MSIYLCPKGHNSTEPDYCSDCGTKIEVNSEPLLSNRTLPSLPPKFSEEVTCPDCSAPHEPDSGNFCEICGYNFVTGVHGEVPIAVSHPPISEPIRLDRKPKNRDL